MRSYLPDMLYNLGFKAPAHILNDLMSRRMRGLTQEEMDRRQERGIQFDDEHPASVCPDCTQNRTPGFGWLYHAGCRKGPVDEYYKCACDEFIDQEVQAALGADPNWIARFHQVD